MRFWLFKSEPDEFSITDLEASQDSTAIWDGIRNYQARNFIRDEISKGDGVLFYHSSCKVPGVVGTAQVITKPYPDPTAIDSKSPYFDPKSSISHPRWYSVDIKFSGYLSHPVSLAQMRIDDYLIDSEFLLLRRNRLSVIPVSEKQWKRVLLLSKQHTDKRPQQ